jgi:hypothetical protein
MVVRAKELTSEQDHGKDGETAGERKRVSESSEVLFSPLRHENVTDGASTSITWSLAFCGRCYADKMTRH